MWKDVLPFFCVCGPSAGEVRGRGKRRQDVKSTVRSGEFLGSGVSQLVKDQVWMLQESPRVAAPRGNRALWVKKKMLVKRKAFLGWETWKVG